MKRFGGSPLLVWDQAHPLYGILGVMFPKNGNFMPKSLLIAVRPVSGALIILHAVLSEDNLLAAQSSAYGSYDDVLL